MKQALNYKALDYFRLLEQEGILDHKHLSEKYSIHFKKLTYADGGEEDIDLFSWHFTKDGKDYLVPMQNSDGSMKDLDGILPLRVKGSPQLVANGGKVYSLIPSSNYTVLKYQPERFYSFKEVVDYLTAFSHSNEEHQKLLWIMMLASYLDVVHFRVSTNPSFGKDSAVDTIGLLMGDASSVENPSLPKFEREISVSSMVALNEVTKIKKGDWDLIQMILLAVAAQKPSIKKRTRKFDGVGEEIDLSNLSLIIMYNDITDYDSPKKYFDNVTDKNVIDRFPAFRFHGRITHDFSKDDSVDFKRVARESQLELRNLIKTLLWYKDNWSKEYSGYSYSLNGVSPRWELNISRILRFVDLYCDSQEEFSKMVALLKKSMVDYSSMLSYPALLEAVYEKINNTFTRPKERREKKSEMQNYLNKENLFSSKIKILDTYLKGESVSNNNRLDEW